MTGAARRKVTAQDVGNSLYALAIRMCTEGSATDKIAALKVLLVVRRELEAELARVTTLADELQELIESDPE